MPVFVVRRNDTLDRRPDGHSRHQRAEDGRDQPSQVEMMRAFSRDAGARGWKLPHAPEHEQGTHYFQSPYNDAVCFSCSATGEWDDMLRANSKKLRSLQREAEAVAYAAERKDLRCQLEATQALTVQMAAEHAETQIQRARMDAKRAVNAQRALLKSMQPGRGLEAAKAHIKSCQGQGRGRGAPCIGAVRVSGPCARVKGEGGVGECCTCCDPTAPTPLFFYFTH